MNFHYVYAPFLLKNERNKYVFFILKEKAAVYKFYSLYTAAFIAYA